MINMYRQINWYRLGSEACPRVVNDRTLLCKEFSPQILADTPDFRYIRKTPKEVAGQPNTCHYSRSDPYTYTLQVTQGVKI